MGTKLERISQLSKENPEMVFTSIGHLINKELLKECHEKMDEKKAVGNLDNLVGRLKKKLYKPKPARRVEIPKDNGKSRPLSIYCYEDKLVQEALRSNTKHCVLTRPNCSYSVTDGMCHDGSNTRK